MSSFDILAWSLSVGLIIFFFYIFLRKRHAAGKSKNGLVILGLSDSGKTTAWTWLRYGLVLPTQTSIDVNEADCTINLLGTQKTMFIVDVPGHPKLRFRYKEYLPITAGVIFTIDSVEFKKNAFSVAEFLYDLLISVQKSSNEISILVACNKCDLKGAASPTEIRCKLEEEIEKLRTVRGKAPDAHTEDLNEQTDELSGLEGTVFRFDHLQNHTTFIETSFISKDMDDKKSKLHCELTSWITDLYV